MSFILWLLLVPVLFVLALILLLFTFGIFSFLHQKDEELNIYKKVISLIIKGDYERAQFILNLPPHPYSSRSQSDKIGELHDSFLELIETLRQKEMSKLKNYSHVPVSSGFMLVPCSHYQIQNQKLLN
jgi:hypothetical protein